jgi:choline kinase
MDEDFICCYSDILFTPGAIALLLQRMEDISLVVDTHWTSRYGARTDHPPEDAEKVVVRNGMVARIDRSRYATRLRLRPQALAE